MRQGMLAEWRDVIAVHHEEWRERREDRRWERGFEQRSWMIQAEDRFAFNPERDFREFDRWIRQQKRAHGREHFRRLRDELKADGAWDPRWSDRSV